MKEDAVVPKQEMKLQETIGIAVRRLAESAAVPRNVVKKDANVVKKDASVLKRE